MIMLSKLNKFFSSVKLAIFLLISIAVLSMVGTFINQGETTAQYKAVLGEKAFLVLYWLGFLNIYGSWYFIALAALLAVNLIVASANTFPRTLRAVFGPCASFDEIAGKKSPKAAYESFASKKNPDEIAAALNSSFGNPGAAASDTAVAGTGARALYYSKNGIFRFSPYIAHLSVLIILAGVMLNVKYGFRSYTNINVGEKTDVSYMMNGSKTVKLPFTVRLDRYRTEYYPNGTPKAYISTVGIIENHVRVLTRNIMVNHPLAYDGITIYQASYGHYKPNEYGILTVDLKNTKYKKMIFVRTGKYYDSGINGIKFKLAKSPAGNENPYYIGIDNGKAVNFIVYRIKNRNFPFIVAKYKNAAFVFTPEAKTYYYSGLEITRNSYTPVIWFGSIMLVAALFFSFFFNHKEIWVKISPAESGKENKTGDKNRIEIIGVPRKKFESFYRYFNEKTAAVKRKLL